MSDSGKQLLSAAWVAPIAFPILCDGAVVINGGRIAAVGSTTALRAQHPDAIETRIADAVLLPGLVNAHAHLDLTHMPRPPKAGAFIDWVKAVIAKSMSHPEPAWWLQSALAGRRECLRFGITSVGDISGRATPLLREAQSTLRDLRVTSYGEVTAMAQRRGLLEERLAIGADTSFAGEMLRIGISPHAPYSVEPDGFRRCLREAIARDFPLTTHLAETPHEREFLESHRGPFGDLWQFLGAWDENVPLFAGGPIRYAKSLGLLDYEKCSLAHVNYCDDDELAILAAGRASVVYCPRTHQYFGHPPHRFREMLAAGINVALGTDSCASSPDLNLVDDLRLVHRMAPEVPAHTLWEMVTIRGARAIAADDVGSLTVGKRADLVAFEVESDDPLVEILERDSAVKAVWVGGVKQHPPAKAQ